MEIKSSFPLNPAQDTPEARSEQERQLRSAAEMYEQHFLREMVRNMRSSVPEGGLITSNFAEKIFREQLDGEYVESWTRQGGVGFADMIYNHVREKYLAPRENLPAPNGPLPLENGYKVQPLPSGQKDRTEFQFRGTEGMDQASRIFVAPWSGKVVESFSDGNGHSKISIDHGNILKSRFLVFGELEPNLLGQEVRPGQRLGSLNGQNPILQWTMGRA